MQLKFGRFAAAQLPFAVMRWPYRIDPVESLTVMPAGLNLIKSILEVQACGYDIPLASGPREIVVFPVGTFVDRRRNSLDTAQDDVADRFRQPLSHSAQRFRPEEPQLIAFYAKQGGGTLLNGQAAATTTVASTSGTCKQPGCKRPVVLPYDFCGGRDACKNTELTAAAVAQQNRPEHSMVEPQICDFYSIVELPPLTLGRALKPAAAGVRTGRKLATTIDWAAARRCRAIRCRTSAVLSRRHHIVALSFAAHLSAVTRVGVGFLQLGRRQDQCCSGP